MKHILFLAQTVTLAVGLVIAAPASADVTLPHVFGSHMVLQGGRAIPIWGWADPEEKVSVQIGDQPAVTAAADKAGAWRVTLPEMPAGGPFTVRVAGKNTITLGDVLVGEVWLCSGQSNMEMAVASCINAHEEIAAANHPQIRHIQVPKLTASVPAKDFPGQWQVCSPETAGGFTACGYFMARELQKKLNVPVGLVHSSWGGTRIEPWTTPAGFAQVPALADIQEMIAKADPHSAEYKDGLAKYLDKLGAWVRATRQSIAAENLIAPMPAFPPDYVPLVRAPTRRGSPRRSTMR